MGHWAGRAGRVGLVLFLAVPAAPLATSCGSKIGPGIACTAIGCGSAVIGRFPLYAVGEPQGDFLARVCLDGACRTARGTLDPHKGRFGQTAPSSFVNSGVEVTAWADVIEVRMELRGENNYDDLARHEFAVELTRNGDDPLVIDADRPFERVEPNGPQCGPTCWLAELAWIASPGS